MVLVTELPNAFWGVTVNEGKRYTQKLTGAIHVSMAALEPGSNNADSGPVSVMIQHDKADFMLCSLSSGQVFQQTLDLNFNEEEEVTFYLKGKGVVHLTGYILTGDQYDSDSDEDFMPGNSFLDESAESSSSDDDAGDILGGSKKRKKSILDKKSKKPKVEIVDDEDDDEDDGDSSADDDDSSDDAESGGRYELIDDEAEEEISYVDSDKDSCEESDMDDDDDEDETPKKKADKKKKPEQSKKHQPAPGGQSKKEEKKEKHNQRPVESTSASKEESTSTETGEKKKKKKKNKNKKENSAQESAGPSDAKGPSKPSSRVVEGVAVEDLKVGHGPEAKAGSTVHVYYTGRLTNGKLFDMKNSGKPAKFRIGKKEVIKGWDVGLQGMKVGGKRKLVIPPNMGYGSQNVGTIPPNSTLQFEVELKAVN